MGGIWLQGYVAPRLLHCAAPCRRVCAGCAAQGLCSIPGQSQPCKACGLILVLTAKHGIYQNFQGNLQKGN